VRAAGRDDEDGLRAGVSRLALLQGAHEPRRVAEGRIAPSGHAIVGLSRAVVLCRIEVRALRIGAEQVAAGVDERQHICSPAALRKLVWGRHVVLESLVLPKQRAQVRDPGLTPCCREVVFVRRPGSDGIAWARPADARVVLPDPPLDRPQYLEFRPLRVQARRHILIEGARAGEEARGPLRLPMLG